MKQTKYRQFDIDRENRQWKYDVEAMRRAMIVLNLANGHPVDVSHWRESLHSIAKRQPQLRKEIQDFFSKLDEKVVDKVSERG